MRDTTELLEQSAVKSKVRPQHLRNRECEMTMRHDREDRLRKHGAKHMTSRHLSQCLCEMNITQSHSRPRTSNDNAFSQSQFKTLKYGPAWPDWRMTFDEWQDWCPLAFDWYNNRHHHEGIAYFAPSQVYRGEHLQLQRVRQRALDQFWKQHPERFVRGQPRAPSLPDQVWINRPESPDQTTNKTEQKVAIS